MGKGGKKKNSRKISNIRKTILGSCQETRQRHYNSQTNPWHQSTTQCQAFPADQISSRHRLLETLCPWKRNAWKRLSILQPEPNLVLGQRLFRTSLVTGQVRYVSLCLIAWLSFPGTIRMENGRLSEFGELDLRYGLRLVLNGFFWMQFILIYI